MIYLFNRKKELQKVIPRSHLASGIQIKVLNGLYELSVEVPIFYVNEKGTKYNYQKTVDKAWFAGHYDINNEFQLYKIHARKIKASESGEFIVFDSVHKFFDDAKGLGNIHDRRFRDSEAYQAAQVAFSHIGWNLADYDTTDRHDINFHRSSVTDAWKDLINTYQVEFDYKFIFDGRKIISQDVTMKKKIGEWTGERFAYGTNLMSLENEQDESEIYTAAIGRGRGEEVGDGYGARLEIDGIEWSKDGITSPVGQNWIEISSATQAYGYYEDNQLKPRIAQEVVFEDTEDPHLLADQTYQWLLENCIPKATWKSEVARVGNLNLGDGVGIIYKDAGIIKQARVQKMEVNLLDHSKSKITLGDYKHFKNKRQQRIDSQIQRVDRDNKSYISRLKEEFTVDFDNRETEMINRIEQARIDMNAETAAAEVRMTEKIESERNQMMEDYNTKVDAAKDHAEQQAAEKADEVQGNLERVTSSHQALIDGLKDDVVNFDDFMGEINQDIENIFGNIGNINDFIGDTTSNLSEQLKSIRDNFDANISNVEGNVSDLSGKIDSVETALNTTKSELQNQLDGSASDIEFAEGKISAAETLLSEHGSKIDAQAIKIENVEGTLSSKANQTELDALEGTVSNHSTSISQNTTDIQSKADSSIVDAINGTVTEQGTLISQNSTDIASKADSSKVNQLEGTISNHSTEISQNSTDIKRKAESSVVNTLNNKVSNQGTEITENASGISSLITKTELHDDDIEEWSNLTESTAEGLSQSITRISNVEGDVNSVSNDLTETAEEVTRTIGRLGTVEDSLSSAETQIVANADGVSALITRTESVEDDISTAFTSIEANAGEIALKANQSELNTVSGNVSDLDAQVDIQASQISSKVNQTDFDYVAGRVDTAETGIIQNSEEISRRLTRDEFESLSIGGRNLILDSAYSKRKVSSTNYNYSRMELSSTLEGDTEYTVSSDVEIYEGSTDIITVIQRQGNNEANGSVGDLEIINGKISATFTTSNYNTNLLLFYAGESGNTAGIGTIFRNVQLERGNTVTDWQPAPEDIDSRITQLSNETTETAEGLEQTISRLNQTEDDISLAQADIVANADEISSTLSLVNDHEVKISSIDQDIDSITTTVASKATLEDVANVGANLIPMSSNAWEDGQYWSGGANNNGGDGMRIKREMAVKVIPNEKYTFTDESIYVSAINQWMIIQQQNGETVGQTLYANRGQSRVLYPEGNEMLFVAIPIDGFGVSPRFLDNEDKRISVKFEKGDKTPILESFSQMEQQVSSINMRVFGELDGGYVTMSEFDIEMDSIRTLVSSLTGVDGETIITQSDITLDPDQIRIGSQQIGGEDLASVISVSPHAIDMITEELNLTGNMNVKGKIESIAMSAIEAEFASLFVDQVEAGVIEASHVAGLTAEFEWLYTLNANMERLVTQNVFTNAVDAISIEAVYANISSVRTRLLTAGVIDAKHLNVNYAMIDELFAYEGRISRLTSKDAFIRDIQAIEITARQLNLNTLTNRVNDIEGGLMITRPDGAVSVNNGVLRPTFNIGFIQPHWMGEGVFTSANYFRTNNTSYTSASAFSVEQCGRYITIKGKAEMRGNTAGTSRNTVGAIRLHEYTSGSASTFQYINSRNDNNGNNQNFDITVDLGKPDYRVKHFYVQFYSSNAESDACFRINQAYQHG